MSSLIKPLPSLDIFSKQDSADPAANPAKLDFTRCNISDLYAVLKRFDKRFSHISQDVTDPLPLEVKRFHRIIEEVATLSITNPLDFDTISYIIKFLNKFPQRALHLQPGTLDVSPLLTSVEVDTSDDTWDALQALERVLTPPLFLGRDVMFLHWTMGAIYGDSMAHYVIGLLARFRYAKEVTFGVQEWFDVHEADTPVDSDSETSSSGPDTQETLVGTEEAELRKLLSKPAREPAIFVPLPKILHWRTAKLDFPLMGASIILSFGCWPRMRHLTLNLAVPDMWPGKTKLEIATYLAHTLSRISVLFPSLQTLRLSTSTVLLCDPTSFVSSSQTARYDQTPVYFKEGTFATPIDSAHYSMALVSLGPKALVPPLEFLTNLDVRAVPKPLLLTFVSQWTCRAQRHNVRLSRRSGGWVVEGEADGYNEWKDFPVELANRAAIARENDLEMNWARSCYRGRLMTGKTREELAHVAQEVRIKVNIKG